MPTYTSGTHLKTYVEPQLVKEIQNDKDDFVGRLKPAPKASIDTDGIKFNKLIGNVEVEINADQSVGETYTATQMTDNKGLVPWDYVDTKPTFVTDEEMRALAYDKRAEVRVEHMAALKRGIRDYVLHKYAPADASNAKMPVLRTTGDADANGRLKLTLADLIAYRTALSKVNLMAGDPELLLILNADHVSDLSLTSINLTQFSNSLYNVKDGKLNSFFGFNFFENNACPYYDNADDKKAIGASVISTDRQASVIIYQPNTIYHVEKVKVLYTPEHMDTVNVSPQSKFRLKTHLLADWKDNYGHGAIVSGIEA